VAAAVITRIRDMETSGSNSAIRRREHPRLRRDRSDPCAVTPDTKPIARSLRAARLFF
jgi:hypothetical protein